MIQLQKAKRFIYNSTRGNVEDTDGTQHKVNISQSSPTEHCSTDLKADHKLQEVVSILVEWSGTLPSSILQGRDRRISGQPGLQSEF